MARKLISKGNIYIKDGNLVVNRQGQALFRLNKNIIIIKEPRTYVFLVMT